MNRVYLLTQSGLRATLRDRTALFFTFLMPVIFMVLFSLIFGSGGSSKPVIEVSGQGPLASALPGVGGLSVRHAATSQQAIARVRSGDASAAVIVNGTNVTVRYAASDPGGAGIVRSILTGVAAQIDLRAAGARPLLTITAAQVEDHALNGIDFYFPGLLAYAVAVSATFGISITLVLWRTRGLLRRLRLTPLRVGELMASRIAISLVIALMQAALMLAIGLVFFNLHLSGAPWAVFPLALLGALCFLGIGLVSGSFAKSEDAAVAIANVLVLPMTFISGVWFPISNAPAWLRDVGKAMPLSYIVDAIKNVSVRGLGVSSVGTDLLAMLAFTAVTITAGLVAFRWDR